MSRILRALLTDHRQPPHRGFPSKPAIQERTIHQPTKGTVTTLIIV
jgi:hypothetical protein